MLAKKFRLPIQSFPKNAPTAFKGGSFSIKSVDNNLGYDRFGVYLSSKVSKKAVIRNKIKRFFFDFYTHRSKAYKKKNRGKDLLIISKPNIIELTPEEIIKDLKDYDRAI